MKKEFINELGNKIGVSVKLRKDNLVIWALWSEKSCQSGVITPLEAKALGELFNNLANDLEFTEDGELI